MPEEDGLSLSLTEAYEKYGTELLHFAASLVGPSVAQDVVSQTFLNCLRRPSWQRAVDTRSYLYRAVQNEVRKHFRTEIRRASREEISARDEVLTDLSPAVSELLQAVAALSLRQRSVVYLAYWLDLDTTSIAALLGISPGAVHRHLARARANLRKRIDRYA